MHLDSGQLLTKIYCLLANFNKSLYLLSFNALLADYMACIMAG